MRAPLQPLAGAGSARGARGGARAGSALAGDGEGDGDNAVTAEPGTACRRATGTSANPHEHGRTSSRTWLKHTPLCPLSSPRGRAQPGTSSSRAQLYLGHPSTSAPSPKRAWATSAQSRPVLCSGCQGLSCWARADCRPPRFTPKMLSAPPPRVQQDAERSGGQQGGVAPRRSLQPSPN